MIYYIFIILFCVTRLREKPDDWKLLHMSRIGLQRNNRQQKDDVFIWNSTVAQVFKEELGKFVTVSLAAAGYFHSSLVALKPVTICRQEPSFDVVADICESAGKTTAVIFFGFVGKYENAYD